MDIGRTDLQGPKLMITNGLIWIQRNFSNTMKVKPSLLCLGRLQLHQHSSKLFWKNGKVLTLLTIILAFWRVLVHFLKHGRGNENHDFVWREYLTNPLLTNPGAWAGGIKSSLPENFFDEELFPTYDYKGIDKFISSNVMIESWLDENEYIKTNLYR